MTRLTIASGWYILAAALSFSCAHASAEGVQAQFEAELSVAPVDVRRGFSSDSARFREFVIGRLHDERVAEYARAKQLDRRADVRAVIGSYERDTLVNAAVNDFLEREAAKLPDLEKLARERYLADSQAYSVPESALISHILIRADVEAMADEEIARRRQLADSIRERIRAGEDFATLAREFSEDTKSAREGGMLPRTVGRANLVPKFADAAWALKPGGVSDVVRTRFGFHIIRLNELTPSTVKPFEAVKAEIIAKLRKELLDPKRTAFIDAFRDRALEAEADQLLPLLEPALAQPRSPGAFN